MFKRLISCAAGLLIGIAPICVPVVNEITMSASAEEKKLDNGLSYTITDGEVKITGYDDSDVSLEIPSEIEGYPVTSIGDYAFYECFHVTEITLPNSITEIGFNALPCSLRRITLPNNLKEIDGAFCSRLRNLIIPESVKYIWRYSLPERIYFKGDIPDNRFSATNDTTVYYPADNPTWTESAIQTKTEFCIQNFDTKFTFIPYYTSENGLFYTINKGKAVIVGCDQSSPSLEIPSMIGNYPVDSIYDNAFADNLQLTNVIIHESATNIANNAFTGCSNLTEINISNYHFIIKKQPKNASAPIGSEVKTEVTAEGKDLSYQWYYCNPSANTFLKSNVKDSTYKCPVTNSTHGRKVYCEITDIHGITLISDTATLYADLSITSQPKNASAPVGSYVWTRVNAIGQDLSYQWYYCEANSDTFIKAKATTPTYECPMTNYTNGRKVYCEITDKDGNIVVSDTVTLSASLYIVKQPENASAPIGSDVRIKVTATGQDLSYQWYYCEANSDTFIKAKATYSTYECPMTNYTNGRKVYCEITDKDGNKLTSDTVTLTADLNIIKQPENASAPIGSDVRTKVTAIGQDLSYQWYYCEANSDTFIKSKATYSTYECTMTNYSNGRKVYCEITDVNGNVVVSDTVTLSADLYIVKQPENVSAPIDSEVKTKVTAKGQDLSYQWYYCEANSDTFIKSKATYSTYECPMTNYSNGRKVYCEITDKDGNIVVSDTVTLSADLYIVKQPENVSAPIDSEVKTKVTAKGQDLSYQWYYCEANSDTFIKSKATYSTYECTMTNYSNGRKVYCEITDVNGNVVVSDTVTLSIS